ncbi:alpha/beta hydrolase [Bifidobacterium choloepi]|uniref:Alpha/beta hydrolase n=1 Tax=Bifidobacterium choloepi TaxID=2614131 RepID=A0A6I5NFU7_9BIFI|nr:alpha/beta hydrolase [Bifidobacterium choloepi]NEG69233.1 alpha/beta hydrolase [Bifidobacterium choloepi]
MNADNTKTTRRHPVRTAFHVACGTAVAGAAVLLAAGELLFQVALDTQSEQSLFRRKADGKYDSFDHTPANVDGASLDWFESTRQPVRILSQDRLKLHAWKFDPDSGRPLPHAYAICLHGYTGGPAEMAPWAHHYAQMGFTVLVPAARGHERSQGRYVTFGWEERRDLMGWINKILAIDPHARILLHGNSMGAATVMLALGEPTLPRAVRAAVVDSGYVSETGQLTDNVAGMLHLPRGMAGWIVSAADVVNRVRLGFPFSKADCLAALGKCRIPVLFIQGTKDEIVSPGSIDLLFAADAGTGRERLVVEDAGHTASMATNPALYWSTVDAFVRRWIPVKVPNPVVATAKKLFGR